LRKAGCKKIRVWRVFCVAKRNSIQYLRAMQKIPISFCTALLAVLLTRCAGNPQTVSQSTKDTTPVVSAAATPPQPAFDTAAYHRLQQYIANGDSSGRWPVKGPLPKEGAILPFNRVVAYYGNLYSNRMGALGKWPKREMIPRLMAEVEKWNQADSLIKAIPALHYIAVTAQSAPGKDGNYRLRMPHHQIDTVLNWAKEINALVFIDVQVGLSDVQREVPQFEKYLSMPNVHFGIDPEFAMKAKGNKKPGSVIGSLDATDINFISGYMADLVKKHNLPPKIFVIHRFTQGMVTNYKNIQLRPEVQIVMDMDGWGGPAKKIDSYKGWISNQPVQFAGFKLFYVNDTEKSGMKEMMSQKQVLSLKPAPVYIQYQ
jgi:hypothetical protein